MRGSRKVYEVSEAGVRINKYLAECGVCSRRGADELIARGAVTVDGKPAENGMKITPDMIVAVDGKEVKGIDEKVYLAFNKPRGIVCTARRSDERNVIDHIGYPKRITYCGRLDKDSEGLLIMTNDGDLIDAMMRSRNVHEKEYIVTVNKTVTDAFLYQFSKGVYLEELGVTTRKCKVSRISDDTFTVILTQGLNRQIRRMCETFGYRVRKLERTRVMNIRLGDLETGKYRELTKDETSELIRQCRQGDKDHE